MTTLDRAALLFAATFTSAAAAQPATEAAPANKPPQHQHQHQHRHHAEHHGQHHGQQGARPGTPVAIAPATGTPRAADALDPAAEVPRLEYRSALRGYRPLADTPPGDWRALNEQVHRVGGWRTYLRQAHAPEPAAPESATKPSTPAAHDHGSKP